MAPSWPSQLNMQASRGCEQRAVQQLKSKNRLQAMSIVTRNSGTPYMSYTLHAASLVDPESDLSWCAYLRSMAASADELLVGCPQLCHPQLLLLHRNLHLVALAGQILQQACQRLFMSTHVVVMPISLCVWRAFPQPQASITTGVQSNSNVRLKLTTPQPTGTSVMQPHQCVHNPKCSCGCCLLAASPSACQSPCIFFICMPKPYRLTQPC